MKPSFRCSELDRTLSCNGSITLVPLVEKRESEEGIEGTALHHAAASTLIKANGAVGDIGPAPEASASHAKWIADYFVRHVVETAPMAWGIECECALEQEFDLFTLTGHIDCIAVAPDASEVIGWDLKTGYNAVDIAESNEQVLGYSVLLMDAYPSLRRITFFIVQPRNDEDDGNPRVSSLVLEGDALQKAVAGFERRMNAAIENANELQSGIKQCRFCSVGIQCPALKQDRDMAKLTMTPEAVAAVRRQPNDEQLVEWVAAMRTLKPAAEAAEEALHHRLNDVECVVGAGITVTRKLTRGSYEVPDEEAFNAAFRQVVPDENARLRGYRPSMTKVKDVIAESIGVPKSGKGAVTADGVFDAQIRPLVVQKERRLLQFNQ